jgi:hypothetical protein
MLATLPILRLIFPDAVFAGTKPVWRIRRRQCLWGLPGKLAAGVHLGMGFAFWLSCTSPGLAAIPEVQTRVPAFGCPANDQSGPARLQTGETMPAPVEPRVAEQIAYYRAESSPGIFAPKGWSCRAWNGSNGSVLVVTPKRIDPPYFPLPTISGAGVMIESSDGGSSGRFHVALVAARLFPLLGGEFINRVRQEHLISDSLFDVEPYPADRLEYLSDRFVEYTTPANTGGLGTDGMFEVSDLPVMGLTIVNLAADVNTLTEVRVRLPPGLNAVAQAIVQLETVCVQLPRGCLGLH